MRKITLPNGTMLPSNASNHVTAVQRCDSPTTTAATRNATKNSTGKGGDTFPLPHETLWSEYLSTDVMQTLLGVDELTLHEYRWASGVFGWLRCKELYGDGSRDIVYAWSVLLDRVLGA